MHVTIYIDNQSLIQFGEHTMTLYSRAHSYLSRDKDKLLVKSEKKGFKEGLG